MQAAVRHAEGAAKRHQRGKKSTGGNLQELRNAFAAALHAGDLDSSARVRVQVMQYGVEKAYGVLEKLHKPYLIACALRGRADLADEHAWSFHSSHQHFLSSMLIASFGYAKDFDNALNAFEMHKERGFTTNEYIATALVSAAGKAQRMEDARKALDDALPQFPQCTALHNAFIDAAIRCRCFVEAQQAYKRMSFLGAQPNLQTYNTLINAAAKQMDLQAALAHENALLADGIQPSERTFCSLLNCAAECCDVHVALNIFCRMQSFSINPNCYVVSALLTAIARSMDITTSGAVSPPLSKKRAMQLSISTVSELLHLDCEPNAAVWSSLASVAASIRSPSFALKAVRWQQSRGHELDAWTLSASLCAAHSAEHCCSRKEKHSVERLLAEFYTAPKSTRTSEATNSAMKLLVEHGRIDSAASLLAQMESGTGPAPTLVSYQVYIDGLVEHNEPAHALRVFRRLRCRGIVPDDTTCASITNVIGKRQTPQAATQAESAFERMKSRGASVGHRAYSELIRAKALSGSVTHANGAFDTMQEMRENGVHLGQECYSYLLEACAALGDAAAASSVLASMAEEGIKPSERSNNMIVSAMARSGNLEQMMQHLVRTAYSGQVHSSTLEAALGAFLNAHYAQRASRVISLAETMRLPISARMYSKVIAALSREGSLLEAEKVLQQANQANLHLRMSAISGLVEARASAGYAADAWELANDRGGIDELNDRALLRLITSCARKGMLSEACRAFETIRAQPYRYENLNARPYVLRAEQMLDALIEESIAQQRIDMAVAVFELSKRNPNVSVSQHALAYLYSKCDYLRKLDIAATMRTAQETARQLAKPKPSKACHHYKGARS